MLLIAGIVGLLYWRRKPQTSTDTKLTSTAKQQQSNAAQATDNNLAAMRNSICFGALRYSNSPNP